MPRGSSSSACIKQASASRKSTVVSFKAKPLKDMNLHHSGGVDYDYESSRNCDAAGCDSICRCSEIYGCEIIDIEPDLLARDWIEFNRITTKAKKNPAFVLAVEKAFNDAGLSNEDFEIETDRGYYGEEIVGVRFVPSQTVIDLEKELEKFKP